eukprot:2306824-Pleurochrysis_carterae.AAC.8
MGTCAGLCAVLPASDACLLLDSRPEHPRLSTPSQCSFLLLSPIPTTMHAVECTMATLRGFPPNEIVSPRLQMGQLSDHRPRQQLEAPILRAEPRRLFGGELIAV